MISPVVPDNSSFPLVPDTFAKSESDTVSKSTKLTVDHQKSRNISITTGEGDVVTISSQERFNTGYYSYNDVTTGNGKLTLQQSNQFDLSVENEFAISVEGDLSKQEAKDIKKSLKLIGKIIKGFQSGNIEKVLKNASKFEKLDTIAGLEAALQQTSSVSYEQQTIDTSAYQTVGEGELDQNTQTATIDSPTTPDLLAGENPDPEVTGTDTNNPNIQEGVNTATDSAAAVVKNPEETLNNVSNLENPNNIISLEAVIQQIINISYKRESINETEGPASVGIEENTQTVATDGPTTPVIQGNVIAENEHSEHDDDGSENESNIGNLNTVTSFEATMQQTSSISYNQQSIDNTTNPASGEIEQNTQTAATDEPTTPATQGNVIAENENAELDTQTEETDGLTNGLSVDLSIDLTASVNRSNVIKEKEHSEHDDDLEASDHNIHKDVNSVTDKMVEAVKKTHEKPDKALRSVQKLFKEFMKSFSGEDSHHSPVMNISKIIENDFFKKISEDREKHSAHDKYSEYNVKKEVNLLLDNVV